MFIFLLFFLLFTFYITVLLYIFQNLSCFCDNFAFLTLLVDCFCSPTWFIHILANFIYYARFVVVIAYILTIFCIIMKNSLFLWHLSISNCCCLLFILFYLKLIHSYTCVWSKNNLVNILVHILIVLLVVYILYYYFTINFSKSHFFLWHLSIFDSSCWLFLFSYLIYSFSC